MQISVNDEQLEVEKLTTVDALLEQLGYHDRRGIAVAVNDQVHPRSAWVNQQLQSGDRVTLIRAAAGG